MRNILEYSIEEVQKAYDVSVEEAHRILSIVGPSKVDLDAFMMVYQDRGDLEHWALNTTHPLSR